MHGSWLGCASPQPAASHEVACRTVEKKNGLAPKAQARYLYVTPGATAAMPVGAPWQNPYSNVGGFPQLRPPTSKGVGTSFVDRRKPPRVLISVRPNSWRPAEHESHTEQTYGL